MRRYIQWKVDRVGGQDWVSLDSYTFQETLLAQIKLLNLKDLRCVLSLRLNKPLANYIN